MIDWDSARKTHSDSRQETFWHVGHNDTDEEDDGFQPAIPKDEWEDTEGNTQDDGHAGDDVDKVCYLDGDGSLATLQTGNQAGDTTHDGPVSGVDDDSSGSTWTEPEIFSSDKTDMKKVG